MAVIDVQSLTKSFGELTAVDEVSFQVEPDEIFGMLGPNGAGKTTTLEVVEGLQSPSSGHVTVLGCDPQEDSYEVKSRIGVQLQASNYFDHLTLAEILDLFGSFYGQSVDVDGLLQVVELDGKRDELVKNLSGGQKQRFSIVASLVNDPEVVFLDEPTTGLDPQARRHMWDKIREINRQGKTIVLTTHYMEEAQLLCDRVAIIDQGRIVALDSPGQLIKNLDSNYRIQVTTQEPVSVAAFQDIEGIVNAAPAENHAHRYELQARPALESLPSLLSAVRERDIPLVDIEVQPANLEDVFIHLTGKELRD